MQPTLFSEINIDGYKLYRLDHLHKKGGGVCAYIRKDMKASVLKYLAYISETNFHQLWIQLQLTKSKSLLICVSYPPPDCPLDCFENLLKPNYIQALVLWKPIFVLGDLNCNMLKDNRWSLVIDLRPCCLLSLFSVKDVNTKLTSFNDIFHSTLDMHAPINTFKVRSRPWLPICYNRN